VNKLSKQFQVVEVVGAGYKILCVVLGVAVCFINSKSSTYKWDTCAPHAILRSLGGRLTEFHCNFTKPGERRKEISYNKSNLNQNDTKSWSNGNGLAAFIKEELIEKVFEVL